MQLLNAKQYAKRRGVSLAAVCESLRRHNGPDTTLPGVIKVGRLGPSWLLEVDISKIKKGRLKKSTKKV
jgi:hypothetical protein